MPVGNISVGNDNLAKNIGAFVQSFAGALGISPSTSTQEARSLGQRLAAPINWLLGGRVNTSELKSRINYDFRGDKPSIPNAFENNKFSQDLFLPGTLRPTLDESYAEGVADSLRRISNDEEAVLAVAKDLAASLRQRDVFKTSATHTDGLINIVQLVANPGTDRSLNAPPYGQTSLYFADDELFAKAVVSQDQSNADTSLYLTRTNLKTVDKVTAMIYSIFDYAIQNDKGTELLPALNKMLATQYAPTDKIH